MISVDHRTFDHVGSFIMDVDMGISEETPLDLNIYWLTCVGMMTGTAMRFQFVDNPESKKNILPTIKDALGEMYQNKELLTFLNVEGACIASFRSVQVIPDNVAWVEIPKTPH